MNEIELFEREIEKFRESKDSIIAIADENGVIHYINKEFEDLYGYSSDEAIGNTFSIVRNKKTPAFFYIKLWQNLKDNNTWDGIIRNKAKDGTEYIVKTLIMQVNIDNTFYYLAESIDVTECIENFSEHNYIYTNELTELHNRNVLIEDINHNTHDYFQLALFDVDYFKGINAYFGYENGDVLIKKVARMFTNHIDYTNYTLYHTSIDEFALVNVCNKEDLPIERSQFRTHCRSMLTNTNKINLKLKDDLDFNISISVGLSYGKDIFTVLKEADLALSCAKETNKRLVDFKTNSELQEHLHERMFWIKEINDVINKKKVIPWIQPILNNSNGKVEKYETLMRLMDSKNEIIAPRHFLEVSKSTRMYDKISGMMIEKTLNHFSTNSEHFSINLTWDDINNKKTVDMVLKYLEKNDDLGPRMTMEIVESESIKNFDIFDEFLDKIRYFKSKLAIDDFGTGYSNFVYLEKMMPDYVKIDGSLIENMIKNEKTEEIVKTIHRLCVSFNIKTIAEFVSSKEIYEKVKEIGIHYSQGYYIDKPYPIKKNGKNIV